MKTLAPILFIALIALAGCSADDLAGPDAVTDDALRSSDVAGSATAHPDFSAESFSIDGVWQASDRRGTVTLSLNEIALPIPISTRTPTAIEGKGVIRGNVNRPLSVTLEGQYRGRGIEIVLFDPRGETLAKGEGSFSTDRSVFKVVLTYRNDQQRDLEFIRR